MAKISRQKISSMGYYEEDFQKDRKWRYDLTVARNARTQTPIVIQENIRQHSCMILGQEYGEEAVKELATETACTCTGHFKEYVTGRIVRCGSKVGQGRRTGNMTSLHFDDHHQYGIKAHTGGGIDFDYSLAVSDSDSIVSVSVSDSK